MKPQLYSFALIATLGLLSCQSNLGHEPASHETAVSFGTIEVWDDSLSDVILPDMRIEALADGFQWSEGPAWDVERQQIYFSDVPQNMAYRWSETEGLKTFLDPSGIDNDQAVGFREPGSNGLLMLPDGDLLLANHGKRALEKLDVDTGEREIIVNSFQKKAFNSPNDIARAQDGTLFFTDPPYGLEGMDASPLKQLDFNGVYRLTTEGVLTVIDKAQTFPNGIALSPDESTLYVAVSDPDNPVIMRYTQDNEGNFGRGEIWFDASAYVNEGLPGLPDGMAVADSGHVFATGPGGIFILSPSGKALGQIRMGRATANCTFGDDGNTLYMTAGDTLARVRVINGVKL